MKRQRLRIFVSSPGDVMAAREVAAQVIEKVAQDYARHFTIEPYLWEYEPMLASGHFQDSVDPPSRFDVVILILESRLGTLLPERTAVREYRGIGGRTPVTGTEWEFEDALAAARVHGVPDLLVYRSRRDAAISTWDAQNRQAILAQIEALEAFWSRHFADKESFIGGYAKFKTLEEFATKFEQDLRRCVERRIEALTPAERATSDRLWPKAPFRGLEAYEFEHAPIFFGRDEAIGSALLRLVTNAQARQPFLLVVGASGSGKSSLVKAGVVPRLLVPQRVSGTAFLRRAVFRPSDAHAGEDLFDALARCLMDGDGQTTGLPELSGHSTTVGKFAQHLREAWAHPDLPFEMVLDRLAEVACKKGRMLRYEQAKLILVVDQLEELFTAERVALEERKRFVQLLAGLVGSGLVWVIATMRADFWHRAGETPELVQMADGQGRLDLLPPTPAELSQMIRRPAEAADISFETHPATGIPLNDLIAEEAAREPGALPLLSYLLDQLYLKDVHEAGGNTLTYASYNALGGLKGAIATKADAVIAAQPPEDQRALRQVLFALVQMSASEGSVNRAVARRAPLSDFPEGTAKRRLVESLLDPSARLLVAEAAGGKAATVRLAHEALVSEWRTAGDYVAANAEALKTRRTVEEHYMRWHALASQGAAARRVRRTRLASPVAAMRARFGRESGLLADVDLADAKRLLRDYREDLAPQLVAYIERSLNHDRRQRRRTVHAVSAVAAAMGVLAVGASYEAEVASAQRDATLQAQLRSLTQTAAARLKDNDVPTAFGILLDVLPHLGAKRPYTSDALTVFQEARAADTRFSAITGHTDRVQSAAFSPDGQRVVTASGDKTARLWDATTGHEIRRLSGHTALVTSAAFSPDGQRIVTASWDKTARLWDTATGREIRLLSGHTDRVQSAAFSPDGRRVVTASADNTACLWDAVTGREIRRLSGHTDSVFSAAFSPDGQRIVTASLDKTARLWDAATGREIRLLSGHTERVTSAVFSPDGRQVVTASGDNTARLWDAATGREIRWLSGHTALVTSAAFSPDGQRIVTASWDKTARLWDTATGREVRLLSGHTDSVFSAAFSPDGRQVVTASADNTARLWNAASNQQILLLSGHTGALNTAAFSPDGRRIVTASFDKTARLWDTATGREIRRLSGHTDVVTSAAFSPDGQRIVTASWDKTARLWDTATGHEIQLLSGHTDSVASAAFSPDGRRIVTASDNTVCIWDAVTGQQMQQLSGHADAVGSAAFSPDGRRVVAASADNTARIWDAATGRQILLLNGHTARVESAAFSPDGRRIVTASDDKTARIWNAETGQQFLLLSGHTDALESAAFSPDGRRVVTSSYDKTARLWDAATGRPILVLGGHTADVGSAAFSPDGRRVVTAATDQTASIWDARVPDLDVQIEWADASQFDPLSNTERLQLGLPAASDLRQWPRAQSKCDQSAAAPYDPDRRAPGVPLDAIVIDIAVAACAQDKSGYNSHPRSVYQHGRALMSKGDFSGARQDFEKALASGYRSANVDLGMLLSRPSAGMLDVPRAVSLYEQAWKKAVKIAAFELGYLYEHGVSTAGNSGYMLAPDPARAWLWYQKAADQSEPNALARIAQRQDTAAFSESDTAKRDSYLLDSFKYYAAAADRARSEDWPDEAWRNWRYRRASLARLLAGEGMMPEVAGVYDGVRQQSAPRPTMLRRLASFVGMK